MKIRALTLSLVTASLVGCGRHDSDHNSPAPSVPPPSGQSTPSPVVNPGPQAPKERVDEISEADSGNQYITVLKTDSQIAEVKVIGLPKNLVLPLGEGPDRILIGLKKKGKDGQDIAPAADDIIGYGARSGRIEVDLKADEEKVLFFNFFIKKADSANVPDGEIQFCVIRSKPENIEINTRAHELIASAYTSQSTAVAIHSLAHTNDAAWFETFKRAYLHRMKNRTDLFSYGALEFAKAVANRSDGANWLSRYEEAFAIVAADAGIRPYEAESLASLAADKGFLAPDLLDHYAYFKNLTTGVTTQQALAYAEKILSSDNVAETSRLTRDAMNFYVENNVGFQSVDKIIKFANRFTEGGNDRKKFEFYQETFFYFASILPQDSTKRFYLEGLTDRALSSKEPGNWLDVFKTTFTALQPTTPKWEDRVNAAIRAADKAFPRGN